MSVRMILAALACLLAAGCAQLAVIEEVTPNVNSDQLAPDMAKWAASCEKFDNWDKAALPYRIYGGTYYVGTCGISAILIAGESEHILIDSGTEAGADIVLANIEALGFSPEQIGLILQSHEHFDHVGGIAKIQQATGADIASSRAAAEVIRAGRNSPDDPQAGLLETFPPAPVSSIVTGGQKLDFGFNTLTAIETPGHTPGALSWQWRECEDGDCKTIVYVDSMSPISNETYRFSDHLEYVTAFRAGIARIASADCDILLTPHPSSSQMETRLTDGSLLVDKGGCKAYAAGITKRLDDRLAKEATDAE